MLLKEVTLKQHQNFVVMQKNEIDGKVFQITEK